MSRFTLIDTKTGRVVLGAPTTSRVVHTAWTQEDRRKRRPVRKAYYRDRRDKAQTDAGFVMVGVLILAIFILSI